MNKNKDFTDCIDVDKAGARLSHLPEAPTGSSQQGAASGPPCLSPVPLV